MVPAGEAARELAVSLDTLRRWDRTHRIRTVRSSGNRRLVPRSEISRLLAYDVTRRRQARQGQRRVALHSSARNRLAGIVTALKVQGLLAEVVLQVGENQVAAIITAESCRALSLKVGHPAVAVIKATSVIIDHAL
jgi:molybdopterin-binding protein